VVTNWVIVALLIRLGDAANRDPDEGELLDGEGRP
jgi:hypothetical protein